MAVPAPASITVGDVIRGSEVRIVWSAVSDAAAYIVQRSVNGSAFDKDPQYNTFNIVPPELIDTAGEDWNTVQYRVQAMAYADKMLVYSDWTVSDVKTAQTETPPTPSTGGRLEQFQNRNGVDIYPRTVMEGVFRQSDGKSLGDVLEEIETTPGPPGPAGADGEPGQPGQNGADGKDGVGVPAGGTKGQFLAKKSSADFDTEWKDPPESESGGGASLENVVTIEGGAELEIEGDFGSAPYTIKITDGEASGGTEGGDSPSVPDQSEPEWVETTLPSTAKWGRIAYGNGKFVAVENGGTKAAYSTDGVNWMAATLPLSTNWWDVTYGGGKFVAVAPNSTKAAYSYDGINWSLATLPVDAAWRSVTYGNGKFVVISYNYGEVACSNDGINWTSATLPSPSFWESVTYGDGKFVAVASGNLTTAVGTTAAYSTDGVNWTETTLPSSAVWYRVTYGSGKFVAVAAQGNKAAYSADGINWTAADLPSSGNWNDVSYGDGMFLAAAIGSTVAYSADGINWADEALPSYANWHGIAYGDGKFVTIAYSNDKAAYYTPGNTSGNTPESPPDNSSGNEPGIYVNGKKVAGIGEPGPPGPAGATGTEGPAGPGVSAGGTAGQVLTKNSSTNYDTQWKTLVSYGTSDLTAGSSSLAAGQMHLVYE